MSKITINSKTYTGQNITIINGRVIADGADITPEEKVIHIAVTGDMQNLSVDACSSVHINGTVKDVSVQSGDVRCGDVSGSVQTMSGDVNCGQVAGSVKTMSGDIHHR